MIQLDVQRVEDFEAAYATVLDALDALKALSVPTEETVLEWHEKFREILARVPPIEDDEPLTHFAEQVAEALGAIGRSSGGAQTESEKRYPRDEGMVLPPETIFRVAVTEEGGVAGSAEANCAFTYTVDDLGGRELDTGLTPERPRYAKCTYETPSADSPGLAYWDADHVLHLYEVLEEIPDTTECEV